MTLKEFKNVLLSVHNNVHHFESHKDDEYIVWHEVGNITLRADGGIAESGARIAVDFFTKTEYSDIPGKLLETLSRQNEIMVSDYETIYEKDTDYIHYAYTCEVI